MNHKCRFFSIISSLGICFSLSAAINTVTVELMSGDVYGFLLAEKPVFSYSEGELIVKSNGSTSYVLSDVKYHHFTDGHVSIVKSLSVSDLRIVAIDESTIKVENSEGHAEVILVNATGRVVSAVKTDSEGSAIVTLPVNKGVYVLSVGRKSVKIIRK